MFQQNPTFTRAMKMTQGAMMENDSNCTSLPLVSRVNQRSLVTRLVHANVLLLPGNGQNCLQIPIPSMATPKKMHIPKGKNHLRTSIPPKRRSQKKKHFFSWYLWGSGIYIRCPGRKARIEPTKSWCFGSDADFPFHFGGPVCFRSPGLDGFQPTKNHPREVKRLILRFRAFVNEIIRYQRSVVWFWPLFLTKICEASKVFFKISIREKNWKYSIYIMFEIWHHYFHKSKTTRCLKKIHAW